MIILNIMSQFLENTANKLESITNSVNESNYNNCNVVNKSPLVATYNNILTDEECEHFIAISKDKLQRALVSENNGGVTSNGRTGSNTWISHDHDEITYNVGKRIAKIINMPLECAEKYQLIYYGPNEEYRKHYDGWEHDGSEKSLRCIKYGGQRLRTALCYLNNVEKGGGTKMTKLNITVNAEKGKLLVFDNTYENSNIKHPLSEHAGLPVEEGEKYAFNLWFRECSRSILYRDFNPEYYLKFDNVNATSNNLVDTINNNIYDRTNLFKYNENRLHDTYDIYSKTEFVNQSLCNNILFLTNLNNDKRKNGWVQLIEAESFTAMLESLLQIDRKFWENINVVEYKPGEIHNEHHTAYDLNSDKGKQYTNKLGQRLYSVTLALSNNIEIAFPKINVTQKMETGDILFYKNVTTNTNIRDMKLERIIKNKSDENCYIANIYIRERSKSGEVLNNNIIQNTIQNINETNEKNNSETIVNTEPEDYTDTLNNVLELFNEKKISKQWNGFKSFKYNFKGDFQQFIKYISDYTILHNSDNCINKENLNKIYQLNDDLPLQVIENVVTEPYKMLLQKYYTETIRQNVWALGDKQSNRYKAHNEPMSRFLHYELLPLIEKITNKKLKPTYTYLSAYVKDADLPAHTDRPDCEYTVSFVVDKPENSSWNIYVHRTKQPIKHKGRYDFTPPLEECEAVDCSSGGLMMFQGTDHIHFREKLEFDYYNILLLHYCSV